MKKTILMAAAIAAGAAVLGYLMRRKNATMHAERKPALRSHHLTDVFAKAKI